MKADMRERALRAAARVALAAFSTGCGGVTEATPEADATAATGAVLPVPGAGEADPDPAVAEPMAGEGEGTGQPGTLADATTRGPDAPLPATSAGGDSASDPDVTSAGVGGAAAAPESEHRCSVPPAPGEVADASMLACCDEFVAPMIHESNLAFADRDAARADSEVLACCSLLIEDGQFGDHYACCEILDFPPGPVCAPWGPPVPPQGALGAMELQA